LAHDEDALEAGGFQVWPDSMAREFAAADGSFSENVVETELSAGSFRTSSRPGLSPVLPP